MIYFLALIPATGLTVAGYFVLYIANKSEGSTRTFGEYLGFWAFTLAGLIVLGAIFASAHGRHGGGMYRMHHGFHGGWSGERQFPETAPQDPRGMPNGPAPPPPPPAR
jgi:hypothetical protein